MTLDKIKCTGLELDTAQEVNGFFYTENGYVMYDCKPDLNQPCVRHYIIDEDGYHREVASGTVELILEQQMNDKQESAMSISERDIENAFIQQEDAAVERELVESDEWVNGDECVTNSGNKIYIAPYPFEDGIHIVADKYCVHRAHISVLSKPLTPEQLAAKEREDTIKEMEDVALTRGDCDDIYEIRYTCAALYDAGYRK